MNEQANQLLTLILTELKELHTTGLVVCFILGVIAMACFHSAYIKRDKD